MEKHLTVLGALYVAFSLLNLLLAAIVFLVLAGGGMLSHNPSAAFITASVGMTIAGIIVLISVPGLVGGIALLKRRSWARILLIILGCINLLHIPFGTLLGAYTLWVLTRQESVELLRT